jgi:hypothetical protein
MRFNEIDLFGVYVAPISLMMVGAWLILMDIKCKMPRNRPLREHQSMRRVIRPQARQAE